MNTQSRSQINSNFPQPSSAIQTGILQRKCASCGNHTIAGSKCEDCKDKHNVLQRKSSNNSQHLEVPPIVHEVLNSSGQPLDKSTRAFFEPRFAHDFSSVPVSSTSPQRSHSSLTIGEPTDIYEQEADRVADSIMLKEKPENKTLSTNKQQGEKFDLSRVRVHTDARAAESARAVNALAYTVGHNIVFGGGRFAPGTHEGRRLIAHELTHVVQQSVSNGASVGHGNQKLSRSPAVGILQRQTRRGAAAGCGICMDDPGGKDAGGIAHTEIQAAFTASNPNIIGEYPVPVVEEGKSAPFIPKVDLSYKTVKQTQKIMNIGEIKPLDDAGKQIEIARKQLQDYARELRANPELKFDEVFRMRDTPPTPLPFFNPNNPSGCPPQLIHVNLTEPGIYQYYCEPPFSELVKDPRCRCRKKEEEKEEKKDVAKPVAKPGQSEENEKKKGPQQQPKADEVKEDDDSVLPKVAVGVGAAATAAAAAYLRKQAKRRAAQLAWRKMAEAAAARRAAQSAGKSAAGKTAGKVVVYAEIAAAAALIIFYSDRVEAKPGPGASPIESLYKAMTTDGTPPSPEMKALIESDPLLKQLAEDAAGGGDGSKLQEEMTRRTLELIRDNPDAFTPEDLEFLAEYSKTAKAASKPSQTVEQLRKAIDAAKAGKTGEGTKDTGVKDASSGKDATSQISQPTRDKLTKAPMPVLNLFRGLLGDGSNAKNLNDAQVQRFLSMMPPGLTAEQVAKLLEKRKAVEGETADQILDSLQAILAELNKPATLNPAAGVPAKPGDKSTDKPGPSDTSTPTPAPAPNVSITTGPTVSGSKKTTPEEVIKELAAKAKKSSFTDITRATYRVTWKPEEKGKPTVGSFISGDLRGKLKDDTEYVGRIEAEVTAVTGSNLKIKFVTATPMVSADGKVVLQPDHFVDREDSVVLDPPHKKK